MLIVCTGIDQDLAVQCLNKTWSVLSDLMTEPITVSATSHAARLDFCIRAIADFFNLNATLDPHRIALCLFDVVKSCKCRLLPTGYMYFD